MSIAFVCLTCRRPRHVARAIASVMANCLDIGLVDRFVIVDDGSPPADIAAMRARWPHFEVHQKPPHLRGQGSSLAVMLDAIDDDLILYWEDDTILAREGPWIGRAMALIDAGFGQVIFDPGSLREPGLRAIATASGAEHFRFANDARAAYAAADQFRYNIDPWPGALARPGLWNARALRDSGIGFHPSDHTNMEYRFARDCAEAGLAIAVLTQCRLFDLGYDVSAYELNDTRRAFDRSLVP